MKKKKITKLKRCRHFHLWCWIFRYTWQHFRAHVLDISQVRIRVYCLRGIYTEHPIVFRHKWDFFFTQFGIRWFEFSSFQNNNMYVQESLRIWCWWLFAVRENLPCFDIFRKDKYLERFRYYPTYGSIAQLAVGNGVVDFLMQQEIHLDFPTNFPFTNFSWKFSPILTFAFDSA